MKQGYDGKKKELGSSWEGGGKDIGRR